jgi:hypothetical protein
MTDQPNWSVTRFVKEYRRRRVVIRPLLLESLAQIPGGQDLPLVDLTGRFVKATETRFTVGPALICGGPGGREGDLQDLRATSVPRACALAPRDRCDSAWRRCWWSVKAAVTPA